MDGCMIWWLGRLIDGSMVGQWVRSCQITQYQINLDLIKIIMFCLKIYNLWRQCQGLTDQLKFIGKTNRLKFIGKTNRLKEMLLFTILANFVYFPCISDRNLFILHLFC